jgi:hypothetical protein
MPLAVSLTLRSSSPQDNNSFWGIQRIVDRYKRQEKLLNNKFQCSVENPERLDTWKSYSDAEAGVNAAPATITNPRVDRCRMRPLVFCTK